MGVAGAGKTRIGQFLAGRLRVPFVDADDHHPESNRVKMKAGTPLDDADRAPWLAVLNGVLRGWHDDGAGGVLACSALKESYRDILRAGMEEGALKFVLLEAPRWLVADRLARRKHAFLNPVLMDSQLATLEVPRDAIIVVNDRPPADIVDEIVGKLGGA
jgi:gluconokinase